MAAEPAHDVVGGGRDAVDEPVDAALEPEPGRLDRDGDDGRADEAGGAVTGDEPGRDHGDDDVDRRRARR